MRKNFFASVFAIALLLPSLVLGQTVKITPVERRMADEITAKQLSNYLYFVASDAMGGRDTPSQGLDTTAEFIKMNLERWGFKGAGDNGTFFQKIALRRDDVDPAASIVDLSGQKFTYRDDLVRLSGNTPGAVTGQMVYAGNGWVVNSKNLDPYQNIDVKGKFVVVHSEGQASGRNPVPMPAGVTQADLSGGRGKDWTDPINYARTHGAAGVIIMPSEYFRTNWAAVVQQYGRGRVTVEKFAPTNAAGPAGASAPVLVASPRLAAAIFSGEAGDPMAGVANSFELSGNKRFSVMVATKPETLWTQNVVALWEGGDPALKSEMVAIGAHYDHVGTNPNAPGDDKIWNGADDDGSGTVAVLSIAEALAKAKTRPKRSILFVWHCGEEKGLWGSQYFNKFPTVDIKNVTAQLNIDMIGRSLNPANIIKCDKPFKPCNEELSKADEIYVIGKDMMSSTLGAIVDGTNKSYLNLAYNTRYDDPTDKNRFFFRSDHFNYAANGIPITFWFDGVHEDYHQASDSPDKIDYTKMEKVARTIFITMLELADLKNRPVVDKKLPPELTRQNN